jgi:hypothetical protein
MELGCRACGSSCLAAHVVLPFFLTYFLVVQSQSRFRCSGPHTYNDVTIPTHVVSAGWIPDFELFHLRGYQFGVLAAPPMARRPSCCARPTYGLRGRVDVVHLRKDTRGVSSELGIGRSRRAALLWAEAGFQWLLGGNPAGLWWFTGPAGVSF